jgi:predicted amidohydrolase
MKIRNSLQDNIAAAKAAILKAAKQKPALIALPEYLSTEDIKRNMHRNPKSSAEDFRPNS